MNILAALTLFSIIGLTLTAIYRAVQNGKVKEYYDPEKPVPIKWGKYTIYLRADEFKAWESLNRQAKKHYLKEFEKKIKDGTYYEVPQEDGTVLIATKEKQEWQK